MARVSKTIEATKADRPPAPERLKRAKHNPEMEIALGSRTRVARVASRMSQTALGEALGISFQQVQKYELGKDRVAVSTLQGIAAALSVPPGTFFDDDIPVLIDRPLSDLRRAMRSTDLLGPVRDPRVLKQVLALVEVLADADHAEVEHHDDGLEEAR